VISDMDINLGEQKLDDSKSEAPKVHVHVYPLNSITFLSKNS